MSSQLRVDKILPVDGAPASGGGGIIQVVQTVKTDTFSTTSTSFTDITGYSVSITPKFDSSKIIVSGTLVVGYGVATAYAMYFRLMRGSTPICVGDSVGSRTQASFGTQGLANTDTTISFPFQFLDSPNTTSATTYKVQATSENPQTLYINRSLETDGDSAIVARFASTLIVMEVSA